MQDVKDNYIEISVSSLEENAQELVKFVKSPVIGVLKCDGYGVGLSCALNAWKKAGVDFFAVSLPSEALQLRQMGFSEDILLMAPVWDKDLLKALLDNNIILTAVSSDNALFYSENCGDHLPKVHIAVDTGMGRFGLRWTQTDDLLQIYKTDRICILGIFSHFASAWEKKYKKTELQFNRFLYAVSAVEKAGYDPGIRHIANSAGALRFPQTRLDAVRIGSALVGRLARPVDVPLNVIGAFRARVVSRKRLKKGDTIGYGATVKLRKDREVAVIAVGQDNGFGFVRQMGAGKVFDTMISALRQIKNPLYVEWKGRKLPLLGTPGTQYSIIDVTGVDIKEGDYVTVRVPMHLFGHNKEYIP